MKIEYIIIHISDSAWGTARDILRWHLQRGWNDIGYNFVILNGYLSTTSNIPILNGSIEVGRSWDIPGAHCLGYNDKSIGICGIGKEGWHPKQIASLITLTRYLMEKFKIPPDHILGHKETESGKKEGKICPNLDMDVVRSEL